jgi:hypothetical protein
MSHARRPNVEETLTVPVGGAPRPPELVDRSFAPEGEYFHVRLHTTDFDRLVDAVSLLERAHRLKAKKGVEKQVLGRFDAGAPAEWATAARRAIDDTERSLADLARLREGLEALRKASKG